MFNPRYTITSTLLENIKQIVSASVRLNSRHFPKLILVELQRQAEEISTYTSNRIEGNPLPLTDVKELLKTLPENLNDSQKEILNYNQILKSLNQKLAKKRIILSLNLILLIQKKVTQDLLLPFESGQLRKQPVFVNDPGVGRTVYWPPDHQDIQNLMNELINFINKNKGKIDPLILAGLFHKQMVIIHPFMDGNGRTTRLATKILLAEMGLNTFNLFSFENYYNQNITRYFETVGLRGNYYDLVSKIDFTSWLEYFTDGILNELLRVEKTLPEINGVNPQTKLQPYHQIILDLIKKKRLRDG